MIHGFRAGLLATVLMTAGILGAAAPAAQGETAFKSGEIVVAPQMSTLAEYPVVRPRDGEPVPVQEILREAAENGRLDMDTYPRITVAGRTLTRSQVTAAGPDLNVVFEPGRTTINLPGGGSAVYGEAEKFPFTPRIIVFPKAVGFKVSLTPKVRTVKSGASVRFKAAVTGTSGKLTYTWSFGDGSDELQTREPTANHTFRGSDLTFPVTLTVTEAGNARNGTAGAMITIGKKVKKTRKPEKRKPNDPAPVATPGGGGGYHDGGYTGPGVYGSQGGSGPGNAMPAAPPAPPEPKQKPAPVVDDGLVPVRGELIDPSIPGQTIDPSTGRPGASESTEPEAGPKGFALSGGAKTALGIAALLGIGGLAEIGSFARFR